MPITIRKLTPADAPAYVDLRATMLATDPLSFIAGPEDDLALRVEVTRERLADAEAAVFGAFAPELVGAVGVSRRTPRKVAHKAGVWGMFVRPAFRGTGIGRLLMQAAIAHARAMPGIVQVMLSVSETSPAARHLYESLGFRLWGTEPRSLRHDGRTADEHHLALRLDV
jgi:RimJ/RimL family protein N-acetyltransferase